MGQLTLCAPWGEYANGVIGAALCGAWCFISIYLSRYSRFAASTAPVSRHIKAGHHLRRRFLALIGREWCRSSVVRFHVLLVLLRWLALFGICSSAAREA